MPYKLTPTKPHTSPPKIPSTCPPWEEESPWLGSQSPSVASASEGAAGDDGLAAGSLTLEGCPTRRIILGPVPWTKPAPASCFIRAAWASSYSQTWF